MRSASFAVLAALGLTASPAATADEAALRALSQGGHAVVMRHAKTSGHSRALVLDPAGNCANEDTLSDEGRAQAQRLRSLLDKAEVRFERVLTSPFCRARETARLAFGDATVEAALTALDLGTAEQARLRTEKINDVLARHAGRSNVALVTHRPNIDALTMELVEEGQVIVAKIQPGGTLEVVANFRP